MTIPWSPPEVCTLLSNEQPLGVAEFDELFEASLEEMTRPNATTLRLMFAGAHGLADRVQDLTDRETACCSFFAFTLTTQADPRPEVQRLRLNVEVPKEHVGVLSAVARGLRPRAGSPRVSQDVRGAGGLVSSAVASRESGEVRVRVCRVVACRRVSEDVRSGRMWGSFAAPGGSS